jgi:hypothetical protein
VLRDERHAMHDDMGLSSVAWRRFVTREATGGRVTRDA